MGVISTPICWGGETEAQRDSRDFPKVKKGVSHGVRTGAQVLLTPRPVLSVRLKGKSDLMNENQCVDWSPP